VRMVGGRCVPMPSARDDDLQMLDGILEVLESGHYAESSQAEVQRLHEELKERRSSGDLDGLDLKSIWASHPGLLSEVITVGVEKALDFVRKEVSKFEKIKKEREFSQSERDFAFNELVPLLEKLTELVSGKKSSGDQGADTQP